MRTRARVASIAVMAMCLGACSSSSTGVPTSSGELESRIVTKVPSAFVEQPSGVYDTGPSDLAKAVKDDGERNAETTLRSEKFVRGYQRIWIGPDHAQIIVFIYQFETVAGARKDFVRTTRVFASKAPPGAHRFVIPGLPSGRAVGIAGADKDTAAAVVYFTTGVFTVQITCNGARLGGLQACATATAKDQYRRL